MTYQWHKVSDLIDMAEDASDLMFPEAPDQFATMQEVYERSLRNAAPIRYPGNAFRNVYFETSGRYADGAGNVYASREEYDAALYRDIVEIGGAILAANDSTEYAGPPLAKPSIWQRIKRMIGL